LSSSASAVETSIRGGIWPASEAWLLDTGLKLFACGVDAERISRFEKLVGESRPWPLVFSAREAAHARKTKNPAEALCAAFCCKEALFKALERPFSFPECEVLDSFRRGKVRSGAVRRYELCPYGHTTNAGALKLSREIRRRFGIRRAIVRILRPAPGELAAVVHVLVRSGAVRRCS